MNILYNIFLYSVWFLATYYVVLILIILFLEKDKLYEKKRLVKSSNPKVTIVIPAYNEEGKINLTIKSLKKIKYENIEFIVVNDGSKDATAREVVENIKGDSRFIFIDRKENKGKAASLNEGIRRAKGGFVATIDADSIIEQDIFSKVLPYFEDERVGAVTVAVRVKNPKSFLHRIFELEYVIGLSLMLKVFSFFDGVFVTPGPFSVYRKSVLLKIGLFDVHNITEDMEIAYRIQKHHYRIENCMDAKVYTIIPPTFKKLMVQRKRWYTGALYTLGKHKDMILNKKYGWFGLFVFLNYALITLGLALFLFSIYLVLSKLVENILYLKYTNFNFFEQLKYFEIDLLTISRSSILGTLALVFTLVVLGIGLYFTKTKWAKKKLGILGYPLLFFFYQFFWFISFAAYLGGKKIKWR